MSGPILAAAGRKGSPAYLPGERRETKSAAKGAMMGAVDAECITRIPVTRHTIPRALSRTCRRCDRATL